MSNAQDALAIAKAAGYEIVHSLGHGSFGRTYLARRNNELFTIKVPITERGLAMLGSESAILHTIEPQCVYHFMCLVSVLPTRPGPPQVVISRYLEGQALSSYVPSYKKHFKGVKLSLTEISSIATQMLTALYVLHSLGVAHRDVKPHNIIYHNGVATLIDFGMATNYPRNVAGTPTFLAPEIYRYADGVVPIEVLKRSDVYGLGVTLYVLVNRQQYPFQPLIAPDSFVHFDYTKYRRSAAVGVDSSGINDLIDSMILQPQTAHSVLGRWNVSAIPEIKYTLGPELFFPK